MHKKAKRAAAKALALVLTLSVAGVAAPDSEAAKKPKLSAKKVTVSVKKTKKIKIKNVKAKQVKKLTVKSSKKSTASVKKNGKTAFTITGKKAGTATITAKLTIKGKKKATTLKVKATVKGGTVPVPTSTPAVSSAPSAAPGTASPAAPSSNPGNVPSAAPSADPTQDPNAGPTAAPNAGVKRVTAKADGIIDNVTLWGVRDNPYAETGYDYTQYGTFSGLFTKWFEVKPAFRTLHELFSAGTAQSLASMKLRATEDAGDAPLFTLGDKGAEVKSIVSTGKLNWDTKEVSDREDHPVGFISRTSESNQWDPDKSDAENEGKQRVTVVDAETLDETGSGDVPAVKVSGRNNNWHGIQVEITDFLTDPSKDYRLSMDVTHRESSHNGEDFYTQIIYQDEEGNELEDRPMLVMQRVTAGEWKTLAANYSSNGTDAAHTFIYINWYGNTTTHDDFYIKNVSVNEIASDKADDTTEILSMSPLYENTENFGFSFGGVIDDSSFKSESYKAVMEKHFASVTTGNALKMYSLLDEEATKASEDGMPVLRKDSPGEEMVKWAYENGIGVRGHTIICDTAMSTNCKYFFHEDYDVTKPLASKEVVLARLESFITQCITYFEQKYPGTIHTWDLVNEAIETGNGGYDPNDERKIQINDNMFYETIGSDYVEYSFLYGRKAVNKLKEQYPDRDVNIKLFYNDFNCFQRNKRDAMCALVRSIQAFGEAQGMGSLIDGVGMQCYIGYKGGEFPENILVTSTKRTADSIPNAVFMFHDLGMKVQFTELTIRNYDEAQNDAHAEYYKKFMQMVMDINNGTMQKVLN